MNHTDYVPTKQSRTAAAPKSVRPTLQRRAGYQLSNRTPHSGSVRHSLMDHPSNRRSWLVAALASSSAGLVQLNSVWADSPTSLTIEGYTGRVSYRPGEELTLHVSTPAPNFSIQITRLGATSELVFEQAGIVGQASPIPENASSHGCAWPALWKMPIPENWTSGYYHVRLFAQDGGGKYTHRGARTAESSCFFIVRAAEPGKNSRILIQLSTNTYNAYNNWGGFSLYAYNGLAGVQGNRVSFHRPPASQFSNWEQPFVAWAEANGYTLDYAANNDLEMHPEELNAYELVLSVGHDEYWSAAMRDSLEAFIGRGGNVA
ncbi:MAG: N,N-dimethylformamidase beta subunit family domain-containing protein, partial [Aureliella sp.]